MVAGLILKLNYEFAEPNMVKFEYMGALSIRCSVAQEFKLSISKLSLEL